MATVLFLLVRAAIGFIIEISKRIVATIAPHYPPHAQRQHPSRHTAGWRRPLGRTWQPPTASEAQAQRIASEIGTMLLTFITHPAELPLAPPQDFGADPQRIHTELLYLRASAVIFVTRVLLDETPLRDAIFSVFDAHFQDLGKPSPDGGAFTQGITNRSPVYLKILGREISHSYSHDHLSSQVGGAFATFCACEGNMLLRTLGAKELLRTVDGAREYLQSLHWVQHSVRAPSPSAEHRQFGGTGTPSDPTPYPYVKPSHLPSQAVAARRPFPFVSALATLLLLVCVLWVSQQPSRGRALVKDESIIPTATGQPLPPAQDSDQLREQSPESNEMPSAMSVPSSPALLLLPASLQEEIARGHKEILSMIGAAMTKGGMQHEDEIVAAKRRIEMLDLGSRLGPRQPPTTQQAQDLNELGLTYLKAGQYPDALLTFQEASRVDVGNVDILHNLGVAYMHTGALDQAEKVLLTALTLSPDHANTWLTLGQSYARHDGATAAVACFANAYRFSRNRKVTRHYLQRLTQNEDERVQKTAQQALQLSLLQVPPQEPRAKEKRQDVRVLLRILSQNEREAE